MKASSAARACTNTTSTSPLSPSFRAAPVPTATRSTRHRFSFSNSGSKTSNRPESLVEVVDASRRAETVSAAVPLSGATTETESGLESEPHPDKNNRHTRTQPGRAIRSADSRTICPRDGSTGSHITIEAVSGRDDSSVRTVFQRTDPASPAVVRIPASMQVDMSPLHDRLCLAGDVRATLIIFAPHPLSGRPLTLGVGTLIPENCLPLSENDQD